MNRHVRLVTISDCEFSGGSAIFGGAIYADNFNGEFLFTNGSVNCTAEIGGGSIFLNGKIDGHILEPKSDISTSLGYGPSIASQPFRMVLERFWIDGSEANLTDIVQLFPNQPFDVAYAVYDAFGQLVRVYPGLSIRLEVSNGVLAGTGEASLRNGRVRFNRVRIQSQPSSVTTLVGRTESGLENVLGIFLKSCPIGYRIVSGVSCQICPVDSYALLVNSAQCLSECNRMRCRGGWDIQYDMGVWFDIDSSGHLYPLPCRNGKCSAGKFRFVENEEGIELPFEQITFRPALGDDGSVVLMNESLQHRYIGSDCLDNRKGVLCAECLEGFSEWGGSCVVCKNPNYFLIVFQVFWMIGILLYVHFSSQGDKSGASTKIIVNFFQTLLIVINFSGWASQLPLESVKEWILLTLPFFEAIFAMVGPSSSSSNEDGLLSGCPFRREKHWVFIVDILQQMMMLCTIGIICCVVLTCLSMRKIQLFCWMKIRRKKQKPDKKESIPELPKREYPRDRKRLIIGYDAPPPTLNERLYKLIEKGLFALRRFLLPNAFIRTAINISIYTYFPIANRTIHYFFGCFKSLSIQKYVLVEKSDVECWTDKTYWLYGLAFIPALIYLLCLPIGFTIFLTCQRRNLQNPSFQKYFGQWYSIYKPNYYWYEIINFSRRSLLSFTDVLASSLVLNFQSDGIEMFLFSVIICIQYLLIIFLHPYQSPVDNRMEAVVSFGLLVMLGLQEKQSLLLESISMMSCILLAIGLMIFLFGNIFWYSFLPKVSHMFRVIKGVLSGKKEERKVEPASDSLHRLDDQEYPRQLNPISPMEDDILSFFERSKERRILPTQTQDEIPHRRSTVFYDGLLIKEEDDDSTYPVTEEVPTRPLSVPKRKRKIKPLQMNETISMDSLMTMTSIDDSLANSKDLLVNRTKISSNSREYPDSSFCESYDYQEEYYIGDSDDEQIFPFSSGIENSARGGFLLVDENAFRKNNIDSHRIPRNTSIQKNETKTNDQITHVSKRKSRRNKRRTSKKKRHRSKDKSEQIHPQTFVTRFLDTVKRK